MDNIWHPKWYSHKSCALFPASSHEVCFSRLGQRQSSSHLKHSSQVLPCHSVEWEPFHSSVSRNSLSSCLSQYIIVQVWVWLRLRVWHILVFLTKIILSHRNADSALKEAISHITWSHVCNTIYKLNDDLPSDNHFHVWKGHRVLCSFYPC